MCHLHHDFLRQDRFVGLFLPLVPATTRVYLLSQRCGVSAARLKEKPRSFETQLVTSEDPLPAPFCVCALLFACVV